ncbi:MAG TPA: sulfatase [Opitutaceae bacterium]|nr:sulfatase [Opitutaceae bacterium]HRJ46377.1 sulfatase [Opitutaceae bacterium]
MNSTPPNVIWIFGDQHRAQSWSGAGDPNLATPNLDRMAAEGIVFRRALSTYPLCCPARAALLTGLHPHQTTVRGHEQPLDPAQPTVAHAFRAAGYHTAWFGKWHLDGFRESDGRAAFHVVGRERRGGFDEWLGYDNNNSPWDCWAHGHGPRGEIPPYHLDGYETDAFTTRLLGYLQERKSAAAPFFAVLSLQPPHNPYAAPEEWMRRHTPARVVLRPNVPDVPRITDRARRELAGYHAMIENLDWNVGRIRTALADLGLARNTILVFFSDHGDMHGSHGQFLKTCPWEESIRVPCIIAGESPYYDRRQGVCDDLVTLTDLAPTTLGLCGLEVPATMTGYDYSFRWRPDRRPKDGLPDAAVLQCLEPTLHPDSVDRPWRGIVTRDGWKYVVLEHQPWLLFNLTDDPFERVNLAHNSVHWQERNRLHNLLRAQLDSAGDVFRLPDDPTFSSP